MSQPQMQEIRDMLHGLVENHELIDHAGEVCAERRLDVIAYLAHTLGIGSRHKEILARMLDAYDARCQHRPANLDTGARADQPHHIPMPFSNRLRGL